MCKRVNSLFISSGFEPESLCVCMLADAESSLLIAEMMRDGDP